MTKAPHCIIDAIPTAHPGARPPAKIALSTLEGIRFEPAHAIVSLEAQSNYTAIHFSDGRRVMVCKTLREIEKQLGRFGPFVRIHRSHAINLTYLSRYIRGKGGEVVLDDGRRLSVSVGRRAGFLAAVARYFG